MISSIIENAKDITLIEVKEKLLKECESLEKNEMTPERPFKVNTGRFKGNKRNGRKWSVLKITLRASKASVSRATKLSI